MPRPLRTAPGGLVYHVLNRANGKRRIFQQERDYLAFERILSDVQERVSMRILAWCIMPNHWHLLLWPHRDGDLSTFMRLATLIHAQRRHAHRASVGTGHLYQGRFKSFAVQDDSHFLTVSRYVEANALAGNLVRRAEDWRWSSLWRTVNGRSDQPPVIDPWPVPRPADWLDYVNRPAAPAEAKALRSCAQRGRPFGAEDWVAGMAAQLGLRSTLRPRGRPSRADEQSWPLLREKCPDPF